MSRSTATRPTAPSGPRRPPARPARRGAVAATVAGSVIVLAGVGVLAVHARSGGAATSANPASFDLPALSGPGSVSLAAHRGRPVVVNFFASWCVFCNQELPGFVQVSSATRGRVDFIGVDTDDPGDGPAMAARFGLARAGFSLAHDVGPAPSSQLYSTFGAQGLPITVFYDAAGHQVDMSDGMLTESQLEDRLHRLYGLSVAAPDANAVATPVIPVIPMGAFELLRAHAGDPAYIPVDVRSPAEFAGGHLPGARNVTLAGADPGAAVGGWNRDATYLVYSDGDGRSTSAADLLHALGFAHVYRITGGLHAWEQKGLPVTTS